MASLRRIGLSALPATKSKAVRIRQPGFFSIDQRAEFDSASEIELNEVALTIQRQHGTGRTWDLTGPPHHDA
jgi:hypothetical protein